MEKNCGRFENLFCLLSPNNTKKSAKSQNFPKTEKYILAKTVCCQKCFNLSVTGT